MEMITRLMERCEAAEVQRIGRRAFRGLESLGVTKPKQAIVAVRDGRIVGAIQFKFYRAGGKKIGYFDYAFVDPDFHNQGIGGILYKAAADYLWEQDCDALAALAKDDNVGSWSLFLKNGFAQISVPELARQFGFFGMLRLYFGTVYAVAIGMDCYVALREQQCPSNKGGNVRQLGAYLLANLFLSVFFVLGKRENIGAFFSAYVIFLVGGVLAGYVGTLFSKRKWRFRFNNGGGLICAFIDCVGGVYPMTGNWYTDRYDNSDSFRRDMGIQSMTGWAFVMILALLPEVAAGRPIFRAFGYIGSVLLVYRVLAVYPFEAFGGARVYRWNKAVFFLMAAASLGIYALNLTR